MNYFNDPARLLDCPCCDGQNFPEDTICWSCGTKLKDEEPELD